MDSEHPTTSRYVVDSDLKQTVAVIAQATEANERQIREVARNAAESFKEVSQLIEKSNISTNSKLESLALSTNTKLENLGATFQASQKPNYMVWIAGIAVIFTLIQAGAKISDLQTKVTMSPIATQAVQSETSLRARESQDMIHSTDIAKLRTDLDTNSARDEVSEKDRQKLNERASKAEDHLAKLETDNQVIVSRLAETETQFRKSYTEHNIQYAQIQRQLIDDQNALHSMGAIIPEAPQGPYYFPESSSAPK